MPTLAQTPAESLAGGAGWVGAGLLGGVLAWLMFVHLPSKDKQIKELIDGKDSFSNAQREQYLGALREQSQYSQRELTRTWETLERWHAEVIDWLKRIHESVREDVHATRNLHQDVLIRTKAADAIRSLNKPAVWRKTLAGIMEGFNEYCESLFGWKTEEVVGKSVYDTIIPPERRKEEEEVLRRIGSGEAVPEYTTERRHKDGRRIRMIVFTNPIIDINGKVTGATTVARELM